MGGGNDGQSKGGTFGGGGRVRFRDTERAFGILPVIARERAVHWANPSEARIIGGVMGEAAMSVPEAMVMWVLAVGALIWVWRTA
jgi:hypothetical protein